MAHSQALGTRPRGDPPGGPLAHRLAALLPDASVVTIPDSYTFVPEDQPALLAGLVVDFACAHATT